MFWPLVSKGALLTNLEHASGTCFAYTFVLQTVYFSKAAPMVSPYTWMLDTSLAPPHVRAD